MNTDEILEGLLSCPNTKPHTLGVFPADLLPARVKKYPAILVCNSDVSTEPGTHWLAMYLPTKKGIAEFFDPFGHPPEYYSHFIVEFLEKNSSKRIHNQQSIQAPRSWACGSHCLFYLKMRCSGIKMQDIVKNLYSTDVYANDVKAVLNTHVTYCTPSECIQSQRCIPIVK